MKKKGGFTLLEILVVLIILGLLVAVGIPYYTGVTEKAKAKEAIEVIAAIKEAEVRYNMETGGWVTFTNNQSYTPSGTGCLDVGWNTKYWNFSATNTGGTLNIIALKSVAPNAGSNITLGGITSTNTQGTWSGNHPGTPQN